ncbi:hypothetical protein P7K49_011083 [Saguinus oedipus]|uniref:Uncharacterized protein n=1 Tax=Saguinus oedipus TaxID=9490 RepID=A0ABQ9VT39_SAGOE|nr:hypothetical protein P7K49_011083 [Saguinus oedipus]
MLGPEGEKRMGKEDQDSRGDYVCKGVQVGTGHSWSIGHCPGTPLLDLPGTWVLCGHLQLCESCSVIESPKGAGRCFPGLVPLTTGGSPASWKGTNIDKASLSRTCVLQPHSAFLTWQEPSGAASPQLQDLVWGLGGYVLAS